MRAVGYQQSLPIEDPASLVDIELSAARVSLPGTTPAHLETSGARWPRKMGTNWFMPALVNRRLGESGSCFGVIRPPC